MLSKKITIIVKSCILIIYVVENIQIILVKKNKNDKLQNVLIMQLKIQDFYNKSLIKNWLE